jgi:acetylornithine deacetylase/succinyl-diaminopimelate desuccinylase-like protein
VTDDPTAAATALVRSCIRNACVNDGSAESGHEERTADVIADLVEGPGLDVARYEPTPGRVSVVARIEGHDPTAPSLCLLGHTDVVPANPDRWQRDPFGGELVDGEIWGRGAVDMLAITCTMGLAVRRLADRGFRPRGTLVYAAVADEVAAGLHRAAHLVDHEWDAVGADFVVTEGGGWPVATSAGPRVQLASAEKGWWWGRITVTGTPGHASRPWRTDNAVVKAAEVVGRLAAAAPPPVVGEVWRRWVEGMAFAPDLAASLVDVTRLERGLDELAATTSVATARMAHACTHLTVAPTVVHGGVKANVLPDEVTLEVDARLLPGQPIEAVERLVRDAIAGIDGVTWVSAAEPATESPMDTPLYDALERAARRLRPDVLALPTLMAGATDARTFRRAGAIAYGFALFSARHDAAELAAMFHGDDERVDTETLRLSTLLWEQLAVDLLG